MRKKAVFNMYSCLYYDMKFNFLAFIYNWSLLMHYEFNSFLPISLWVSFFNHLFIHSIIYQMSNIEGHWTSIWSIEKKRHCALEPQTFIQRLNRLKQQYIMIKVPTGLCTSSYQNIEGHFTQTKEKKNLILQKGKKEITWFWFEACSRVFQAKWE